MAGELRGMVAQLVQDALRATLPGMAGPSSISMSPDHTQQAMDVLPAMDANDADENANPPPHALPLPGGMAPGMNELGVDLTIPATTRNAIVAHKFVDLGTLLHSSDGEESTTFDLIDGRLRPRRTTRAITSFSSWVTAFLRFAGVYLTAHPADAGGIIKHMQQVSMLQVPGLGNAWREFDERFRRARELAPQAYPWGVTAPNSALWLSAMGQGIGGAARAPPAPARANGGGQTFRVCYGFNSPNGCRRDNCTWLHRCRICRGPHPGHACRRSSYKRGPAGRGVAAKSERK